MVERSNQQHGKSRGRKRGGKVFPKKTRTGGNCVKEGLTSGGGGMSEKNLCHVAGGDLKPIEEMLTSC